MTILTADRNTVVALGEILEQPVGAAVRIFAGALVMRNAAGFVIPGRTATGSFGVGVAEAPADNTGGGQRGNRRALPHRDRRAVPQLDRRRSDRSGGRWPARLDRR